MNKLLYPLFLCLFFLDYFHYTLQVTPRFTTWAPEVFAMLATLIVALRFGAKKQLFFSGKYVILISVYLLTILIGIVLNAVPPGQIVIALRDYVRYLPFFVLPAVYNFSEEEFNKQLRFILALLILQCPLSAYQRFVQYKGVLTGDVVTGTLAWSGPLSIVMVSSIAVIFALYLKKKIGFKFFFIIASCLFLPTALNETKVTLFLLPVSLVLPAVFYQGEAVSTKLKSLFAMALIGVLFIAAFIPIYDHFMKPREGLGLSDYLEFEMTGRGYLYYGAEGQPGEKVGRFDSIVLAYKTVSQNFSALTFGLGIGSARDTYFQSFVKDRSTQMQYKGPSITLSYLLWEIGFVGIMVYLAFYLALFRDSLVLKQSNDMFGSFALGWSAVIPIMTICFVYINTVLNTTLCCMFWYLSGIVAGKTCAMRALPTGYATRHVTIPRRLQPQEQRK